jgi:hypothetical protein
VTGTNHQNRRGHRVDRIATLVRSVPVRLVEVSRGGCRLECSSPFESGTSGVLAVELAGLLRIDDIRVARCQQRIGAGSVFHVGAELLRTRRLGRRTIRMAVGRIIGGEPGIARGMRDPEPVLPAGTRPKEVSGKSDGRAPPGASDRGS